MVPLTAAVSSPSLRPISTADQDFPSKAELLGALPEELLRHDPLKSWGSLALSLGLSLFAYGLGTLIPLSWAALPLWLVYGVVTGTVAMGCWVLAHECGHNAFHPNRRVEGVVGFVLHSLLLVPYYCGVLEPSRAFGEEARRCGGASVQARRREAGSHAQGACTWRLPGSSAAPCGPQPWRARGIAPIESPTLD